jgi:hypothetical protein
METVAPKAGRPKGLCIAVCACGWRVAGMGKSTTCEACGKRVTFPPKRRKKGKAAA